MDIILQLCENSNAKFNQSFVKFRHCGSVHLLVKSIPLCFTVFFVKYTHG